MPDVKFSEVQKKHQDAIQKLGQELAVATKELERQKALEKAQIADVEKHTKLHLAAKVAQTAAERDEKAATQAKDKKKLEDAKKRAATQKKSGADLWKKIESMEKDVKKTRAAIDKGKTNVAVMEKKLAQYQQQLAKFNVENQGARMNTSMPEKKMKQVEESYFVLIKELDLGLGDTTKKLNQKIDAKQKERDKLKAEMEKIFEDPATPEQPDAYKKQQKRSDQITFEMSKLGNEIKILAARRDEYVKEKQALKDRLKDKSISKDKYDKLKKRLQDVVKFSKTV